MRGKEELIDLCTQLRGEKLIVSSEQEQLHKLDADVSQKLNELLQITWISFHQQCKISNLVHSADQSTPQETCRHIKLLEQTNFVDSCKRLKRYDCFVRQLISALLNDSRLVAQLLNALDSRHFEPESVSTFDLCNMIFSDLYACCVFETDEKLVAEILLELMRLQLVPNANPRLLLRRGNCSFSRLYKLFNENMFPAKVFLTCALHEPIMDVLSMDDVHLDIDPAKLLVRFSAEERLEKFGREDSPQYYENVSKYRKSVVTKLFNLSQKFIQNIKASLHCFPPVISLLVRRLNDMLICRRQQQDQPEESAQAEAALISVDLIFTNFICPAIAKPESLAIVTDTPVGSVARFNLMQIGQILQSLAVCQHERLDPKFDDLFSQFEPTCVVGGIVGAILAPNGSHQLTMDSLYNRQDVCGEIGGVFENRPSSIGRQSVLISSRDLEHLVTTLRRFVGLANSEETESFGELRDLLEKVPKKFIDFDSDLPNDFNGGGGRLAGYSPFSQAKATLKLPHARLTQATRGTSGDGAFSPVREVSNGSAWKSEKIAPFEVLKLRLSDADSSLQLETLSEEDFLVTMRSGASSVKNSENSAGEKKTRFDLESLETAASDQMEPSTDEEESVSSSLDALNAQDQAMGDNFSDVDGLPISANVSGRGSPNVSGRDTPLSQHTELHEDIAQDAEEEAGEEPEDGVPSSHSDERSAEPQQARQLPALPNTAHKENRADIEEKFCKFEIPQPTRRERHRDETHSMVSDSWSTDVLASDSEFAFDQQQGGANPGALPDLVPGGVPDFARLDLIAEEIVVAGGFGGPASSTVALPSAVVAVGVPPSRGNDRMSGMSNGRPMPAILPTVHFETDIFPSSATSALCDRSDTWSVDATASDSDADALRADDRMKEFDDINLPSMPDGLSPVGSSSIARHVTATTLSMTSSKKDENRFEVRRRISETFSPIKNKPEIGVGSTHTAMNPRLLDVRRSEPFVAVAPPTFDSLVTVQSTLSVGSTFLASGACNSANWSEMSTLGSFSQRSVAFSDDSSEPPPSVPPAGHSADHSASSDEMAAANLGKGEKLTCRDDEKTLIELRTADDVPSIELEEGSSALDGVNSPYKKDASPSKSESALHSNFLEHASTESNSPRRRKIDFNEPSYSKEFASGAIPKKHGFVDGMSRPPNGSSDFMLQDSQQQFFDKDDKKRNFLRNFKLSTLKSKVRRSVTDNYLASALSSSSPTTASSFASVRGFVDNAGAAATSASSTFVVGGDGPKLAASAGGFLAPDGVPHSASADSLTTAIGRRLKDDERARTGDQILAKYRSRRAIPTADLDDQPGAMEVCPNAGAASHQNPSHNFAAGNVPCVDSSPKQPAKDAREVGLGSCPPYYDPQNVTKCQAFADVKRKLRMVLSSINVGTMSVGLNLLPSYGPSSLKNSRETELVQFLNVLLAEALNTSEKFLSSQLREVLRCLELFDAKGIRKLVRSLHEEHRHRGAYVTYLQQCRLNYLQVQSYFEKMITRINREQKLNREWLIEFCVRLYIDQACESQLKFFAEQFKSIQMQDERMDFVEKFLSKLHASMLNDQMWHSASDDQLAYARLSFERCVMAMIYTHAFYPNGEADVFRDEVFFEAIKRLASGLTPSHKDLRIPSEYQVECPWPLAQAEIAIMNAYKTPRDRLGCVLRCCETIVNLMRVSRPTLAPSADDIVPVLVFVLVKANPPALLSTVQYIEGFYGKRLTGEEAYWWTQFRAAVEFVKVMVNYNKS